ncbi:hypothetical protein CDAR_463771 [Caerostris darwini]|uniref:Uncharacterized protein n=1 Tax=Caerostris darwini TaxID=1538125 RepID=A0AAV4W2S2_9ARAC|nr:hypothetical protein CDAR_463771 [Caerostris darwini]
MRHEAASFTGTFPFSGSGRNWKGKRGERFPKAGTLGLPERKLGRLARVLDGMLRSGLMIFNKRGTHRTLGGLCSVWDNDWKIDLKSIICCATGKRKNSTITSIYRQNSSSSEILVAKQAPCSEQSEVRKLRICSPAQSRTNQRLKLTSIRAR